MAGVFAVIQVEGAGEVLDAHDVRHVRVAEELHGEPPARGRGPPRESWRL
jgi:hypothetical protein